MNIASDPRFRDGITRHWGRWLRYGLWLIGLWLLGCSGGRPETETRTQTQALKSQGARAGTTPGVAASRWASKARPTRALAAGHRAVWLQMRGSASLTSARSIRDWKSRGEAVYTSLTRAAQRSQAPLIAELERRRVRYKSHWIVNAIRIEADETTIQELARRPDVARVVESRTWEIPPPQPATPQHKVNAVEWNIANVRAPEVWTDFGTRGEGVVVATIDSGAEWDHPALVNQYRGTQADGSVDHNYNWFDPSSVCGSPSDEPCDNYGHGTHTMGTIVGDDGDENQIGVAPGAKWMTAKGCEEDWCSDEALLASGEWMLAPTDLNGQNPRPDLRPQIVSNSWGGWSGDDFYRDAVEAWVAAGIFPVFAIGNDGDYCGSASSPGDYPESYGVGAYDISEELAWFSGRGPSFYEVIKPNIAAPGVDVRSSVPGGDYEWNSGTSMATPHVAGSVALLWSAAVAYSGDIEGTRLVLDSSAIDHEDLSCGGDADNNNAWGEGQLDAYEALVIANPGPTGTLSGTVTSSADGAPIVGARVLADGERDRTTSTDNTGTYSIRLPVGEYAVSASAFGFYTGTGTATIVEEETVTLDFALEQAPTHAVVGTVVDPEGAPLADAEVTLRGTPLPAQTTDEAGYFEFPAVPEGEYVLHASSGGCILDADLAIEVDGDEDLDVLLDYKTDAWGYQCRPVTFEYVPGETRLGLSGDDEQVSVDLPFTFSLYGEAYDSLFVTTNGYAAFVSEYPAFWHESIPTTYEPNAAMYVLWDDLWVDYGGIYTATIGDAPNRRFVVEWRDVAFLYDETQTASFELVLSENGDIVMQWASADSQYAQGSNATIGIENGTGDIALQYSYNEAGVTEGMAILYEEPYTGFLRGVVRSADGSAPIRGATVTATRTDNGLARRTVTDDSGTYSLRLPVGEFNVDVSAFGFYAESGSATIEEEATVVLDFALDEVPTHVVSGTVIDSEGTPIAGAQVTLQDTPLPTATTDASGYFEFSVVPEGEYVLHASRIGCYLDANIAVVVDSDETVTATLDAKTDAWGYQCRPVTYEYIPGETVLNLSGDYSQVSVDLPFTVPLYGEAYESLIVTTNGYAAFISDYPEYWNESIPNPWSPNAAMYVLWDDLWVDYGEISTATVGEAPNRKFVVEWRNVDFYEDESQTASFELVLSENGDIVMQYASADTPYAQGSNATIGIENAAGNIALQYSYNEASVQSGTAVLYEVPHSGFIRGVVSDGNDGLPISGATVTATNADGDEVRVTHTNSSGVYMLQLVEGYYTLDIAKSNYTPASSSVVVMEDETIFLGFSLWTGVAVLTPATLQLTLAQDEVRTRTFVLRNEGTAWMDFEIRESGGALQPTVRVAAPPSAPLDPLARTTQGLFVESVMRGAITPSTPGDIMSSFTPVGLELAWGVGEAENLWLSDAYMVSNHEFTLDGTPTGVSYDAPWSGSWPGDMAFDETRGLVCQVAVGGNNGIHCWNPATGEVEVSITDGPWTDISQRGLAYRAEDDVFFVGGWNEGIIYQVRGASYDDPGTVISQCSPSDYAISGLAYNASANVLWMATNSESDTIYELNPDDCSILATMAPPQGGMFQGAGLDLDTEGNLWAVAQSPNQVYLTESGVPEFSDIPWLVAQPTSGSIRNRAEQAIDVTVDTTGLEPGLYLGTMTVKTTAGRQPSIRVPVSLVVSAYLHGINCGGSEYVDALTDTWEADRAYSSGAYGYVQRGAARATKEVISGTEDQELYQSQRENAYAYRFDNVPNGTYQLDLNFAEIQQRVRMGQRLFDVIAEDELLLPAHDIVYEVGTFAADPNRFQVAVTDGQLDVRLVSRTRKAPVINAIRVTHRPDL